MKTKQILKEIDSKIKEIEDHGIHVEWQIYNHPAYIETLKEYKKLIGNLKKEILLKEINKKIKKLKDNCLYYFSDAYLHHDQGIIDGLAVIKSLLKQKGVKSCNINDHNGRS